MMQWDSKKALDGLGAAEERSMGGYIFYPVATSNRLGSFFFQLVFFFSVTSPIVTAMRLASPTMRSIRAHEAHLPERILALLRCKGEGQRGRGSGRVPEFRLYISRTDMSV